VPGHARKLRKDAVTLQRSGLGVDVDIFAVGEGLGVAVIKAGLNCAALMLAPLLSVRLQAKIETIANTRIKNLFIVPFLWGNKKAP
jgi:hypothetical protein